MHCTDTSATAAYICPESPGGKQYLFGRHTGIKGLETLEPLQLKDEFKIVTTKTVIQEPIVTDLLKAFRQYMHKKTPYELSVINGSNMACSGFRVPCKEGNLIRGD